MESTAPTNSLRSDAAILGLFASSLLIVHFALGNGYGFHQDELQFLNDGRHLQWGFTAYPPLTSLCARVAVALFGVSPQALRLPSAIVNALSLVLTGLMARELGGRRFAQAVALFFALPLALIFSSVLKYTSFDLFSWCIVMFFTARYLRTGDGRWWIGAGVGVGIGVLSKYSIAFPVAGLLAAIAFMPSQRHALRSRWFWCGVLTAAVIAAPNLIWLARHQFITLRMEHSIHLRDAGNARAIDFYKEQIKFTLCGLLMAAIGFAWLLRSPRFRLLIAFFIGPFVLLAALKGRGYYLVPAYSVLYAAGGVAVERALAQSPKRMRWWVTTLLAVSVLADTAAGSWVYLPMARVGSTQWVWQMKHNSNLADQIGWPDFVQQVAAVRDGLSQAERDHLAVLANHYGEAGALALFGPRYGLPPVISSVNAFHSYGYGIPAETVIVVGAELEEERKNFNDCSVAAKVRIPFGVKNEEYPGRPVILVCHHLRMPWPDFWFQSQTFE